MANTMNKQAAVSVITDEQIRELRRTYGACIGHRETCECATCNDARTTHAYCDMAMWGYKGEPETLIATARCAEILSARAAKAGAK